MASENKKRKLKNSFCVGAALKEKTIKLKRIAFYTSAKRQVIKKSDTERED